MFNFIYKNIRKSSYNLVYNQPIVFVDIAIAIEIKSKEIFVVEIMKSKTSGLNVTYKNNKETRS